MAKRNREKKSLDFIALGERKVPGMYCDVIFGSGVVSPAPPPRVITTAAEAAELYGEDSAAHSFMMQHEKRSAAIGDAIVASINGKEHLPVTAANAAGTVTLTARLKGNALDESNRPPKHSESLRPMPSEDMVLIARGACFAAGAQLNHVDFGHGDMRVLIEGTYEQSVEVEALLRRSLSLSVAVHVLVGRPPQSTSAPDPRADMISAIIDRQVAQGGVDCDGSRAQAERWCAMLAGCVCDGMRATTKSSAYRMTMRDMWSVVRGARWNIATERCNATLGRPE